MELSNEENYINFVNLRSNSNFPYLVLEIIMDIVIQEMLVLKLHTGMRICSLYI
jgi:hypothetical protein